MKSFGSRNPSMVEKEQDLRGGRFCFTWGQGGVRHASHRDATLSPDLHLRLFTLSQAADLKEACSHVVMICVCFQGISHLLTVYNHMDAVIMCSVHCYLPVAVMEAAEHKTKSLIWPFIHHVTPAGYIQCAGSKDSSELDFISLN